MLSNFLAKYQVVGLLGEGTFSEVLKCSEIITGKLVAAKRLKKMIRSTEEALELPEMTTLSKISEHVNVMQLLESHIDLNRGSVTLVFELMDMSLHDAMRQVKRPWGEEISKNYLFQIARGVEHIHNQGIFHRDLKPENILMKGDILKVSDLGCAKALGTGPPYTGYVSTRWYRPPECLLTTGFYGPKMDVWAIGCVFYELLTFKPLFPGNDEIDQVDRINEVLGTPNARLLAKFRRHSLRNAGAIRFPPKLGRGVASLLPYNTQPCKEVLKQMVVYDPDSRTNLRRLTESRFFVDCRKLNPNCTAAAAHLHCSKKPKEHKVGAGGDAECLLTSSKRVRKCPPLPLPRGKPHPIVAPFPQRNTLRLCC